MVGRWRRARVVVAATVLVLVSVRAGLYVRDVLRLSTTEAALFLVCAVLWPPALAAAWRTVGGRRVAALCMAVVTLGVFCLGMVAAAVECNLSARERAAGMAASTC